MSGHRSGDDAFEAVRPRLHGIAYRMTGSVGDADDLCQEAWIRWSAADRATVRDPEAFLVTVTTRLALDRLRSARHRRETYVGPYLPEPVVANLQPADTTTLDQPRIFVSWLNSWRPAERVDLLIRMGAALRDLGDVLAGRNALVDAAIAAEARGDRRSVATALALGAGMAYVLAARRTHTTRQKVVVGALVLAMLAVVWAELAVGLFR